MSLVTVSDCGAGVNLDMLPSELAPGMWSDGRNVCFPNGFAEKRKGIQSAFTTPTAVPYWVDTFSTATARFLIQAGTATIYADDGSARTNVTPASVPTGGRDDRWTGGVFNGVHIINNGVNSPMYWNGDTGTDYAALTSWVAGDKADAMRPFGFYIVFGGYTPSGGSKKPYRVLWSSAADPGALPSAYAAAATNDAGDVDLTGAGKVVDFMPLGDVNIVYCQEGRYAMQYIGGNDVFRFVRLPGNDGLLAKGCVAATPKGHVFLSNGDVLLHSGGEAISIAEGRIRKWLTSTIDTTNAARAFVTLNPQQKEVWIVFPSTGQSDCDTAIAWNWEKDTWSTPFSLSSVTYGAYGLISSGLSGSWSADTETWDQDITTWDQDPYSSNEARLILATSTPRIGLANTGSLDFGSTVDWFLEKRGVSLGSTDALKIPSRCRPHLDAVAGTQITVRMTTTMNPDDAPVFSGSAGYTQGTSNWANQFAKAGRYAAIRLEGQDDQQVALRSFDLELADSRARF